MGVQFSERTNTAPPPLGKQDDDTPTTTIKVAKDSKKKLSLFLVYLQEGHLAEEDVSMGTN
jgi:hypothetical protein